MAEHRTPGELRRAYPMHTARQAQYSLLQAWRDWRLGILTEVELRQVCAAIKDRIAELERVVR